MLNTISSNSQSLQTKLQNIKNLIPFIPKEDGEKDRIMTLLGNGEKKAEQDIPLIEFPFFENNKTSTLTEISDSYICQQSSSTTVNFVNVVR
jgi:hypothetical protein